MTLSLDLTQRLLDKRAEVANYERILAAYRGRWYDMGRRHLAGLREELQALEAEVTASSDGPVP